MKLNIPYWRRRHTVCRWKVKLRQIDDLLMHLQREKNVGDTINLEILRDGEIMNIVLTLEKRPESLIAASNPYF